MRSQWVTCVRNSGSRSRTSRICSRLVRAGKRTDVLTMAHDMEHPFGRQEQGPETGEAPRSDTVTDRRYDPWVARTTVAVNAQGRITLPADARRSLGLSDGTQLEVRVEDNEIRLRPARIVIAEDAWAYTAESLASIKRSLAD